MSTWADSFDSPEKFHGWASPEEKSDRSDRSDDNSDQFHEALSDPDINPDIMTTPVDFNEVIKQAVAAQAEQTNNTILAFRKQHFEPLEEEVKIVDGKVDVLANGMEQELRRARFADFAMHHKITNIDC